MKDMVIEYVLVVNNVIDCVETCFMIWIELNYEENLKRNHKNGT